MGLSFHDEDSMVQAAGSLCFASDNPHSIPKAGSIDIVDQEGRDEDQQSDEIHIVER
jgi:hypothetical protein